MKELNFSSFELWITEDRDEKIFEYNKQECACLCCTGEIYDNLQAKYIVTVSCDKDYLFMYFKFGNPYPYSENSLDVDNDELIQTTRRPSEAELNKQVFVLYSFKNNIMYLSNTKKKQLVCDYCSEKLHKEVRIRNIYKNPDEFYNSIKTIDSIRMVKKRDILTFNEDIFKNASDKFGLGDANQYQIELSFGKVKKTKEF